MHRVIIGSEKYLYSANVFKALFKSHFNPVLLNQFTNIKCITLQYVKSIEMFSSCLLLRAKIHQTGHIFRTRCIKLYIYNVTITIFSLFYIPCFDLNIYIIKKGYRLKLKIHFLTTNIFFRHCTVNHTCNIKTISIFCMHRRLPQRNPFNQNR